MYGLKRHSRTRIKAPRGFAMSNSALIVVVIVAFVAVVAFALIVKNQRSQKLKARYGPEYQRTLQETGSKTQAEAALERRQKRVERFHITPLSPEARANFGTAWQRIQAQFVDDPKAALSEADRLIQEIMSTRGYPVADFDQRAADLSVDHAVVVDNYRAGHDISVRHAQGRASTEDMRQAMIHYRALFVELAGELAPARSTAARAASV
jgi:hypothetical protein